MFDAWICQSGIVVVFTHIAQSTQGTRWPGVIWGSSPPCCNINACVPGSKYLVSFSGVGVVVELWVPQPLSMRPGQSSCGLYTNPQDLPVQGSST